MIRTQSKRKWILAAALVLTAALTPARASSPNLLVSNSGHIAPRACGQKILDQGDTTDVIGNAYGTCTAGSDNCCYGFPETPCASGRFQSV